MQNTMAAGKKNKGAWGKLKRDKGKGENCIKNGGKMP